MRGVFCCRRYGGDRIWVPAFGDLEIVSYHVGQRVVRARDVNHANPAVVFQLDPNATSDRKLYESRFVARWIQLRADYEYHEDYVDFFPALYSDLTALANHKLEIWTETTSAKAPTDEASTKLNARAKTT